MAKRLVAVMIVLIISFSSCGCVYKNKTVELDEVVEYEKACFEKAKEVVEAAGFNLSRGKEKLNVETEHIMTSAYINMEEHFDKLCFLQYHPIVPDCIYKI